MMNDVIMISVPLDRYEELITLEARMQFIREIYERENYVSSDDYRVMLGFKAKETEEKSDDKD